jgi:1-acyl-sn-glycerol-3-phosphate acyltransferase
MAWFVDREVQERVRALEIPFNELGVDRYGISASHLERSLSWLAFLYKRYFSVRCFDIDRVPSRGRGMLVGNHSGGVAVDGAMTIASCFLEKNPPRLAQGMIEKFMNMVPFMNQWSARSGQFTGLPEHCIRLLEDDRLLMVFPEGARGTAKLYKERYSLVQFGSGFVRMALQTKTPIIPFAFIGGGDAIPTISNAYTLGKLVGAPYIPVTPYLFAVPLPVRLEIHYGEPLVFEGTGNEDDETIYGYVAQVKSRIAELIERGRNHRESGSFRSTSA